MELEYIKFIGATNFSSGVLQRASGDIFKYVGFDTTQNKVYQPTSTDLSLVETDGIIYTPNSFIGNNKGQNTVYHGGKSTGRYTRIYKNGTYQNTLWAGGWFADYLAYHSVNTINYGFDGYYVVYVISDTNKSGVVCYKENFYTNSAGINWYKLEYKNKLDYTSTLTNPGSELISNNLIVVNGYIIGGFSDVGLMSFSLSTDGNFTQEDRISGGTNNYIQSVVNYGNYLYFTSAGSNSIALQKCELTGGGTFSSPTTVVSTGTTAGAITIKGDRLYYGSQMELHKFIINENNGDLTHEQTYNLSTDYFTNAKIRDINIDTVTDYMVIETTEGRVYVLEKQTPISAGSKNRIIFMT